MTFRRKREIFIPPESLPACGGSSLSSWSHRTPPTSLLSSPWSEWIHRSRAPRTWPSRHESNMARSRAVAQSLSSGWVEQAVDCDLFASDGDLFAKVAEVNWWLIAFPSSRQDSNFSTYQKMWSAMEAQRPSPFTTSNNEGVERVLKANGLYAFLMESTSIEYTIERKCDLTQIGGMLDSKGSRPAELDWAENHSDLLLGYGIAMRQGSPYRTLISGAILKLQEEGRLHVLKTRWWKEKHGGGSCRVSKVLLSRSRPGLIPESLLVGRHIKVQLDG